MTKIILKYLRENLDKILKFIIVVAIGIIIGVFISSMNEIYAQNIKNTFELSKKSNFENVNIVVNGLKNNALMLIIFSFSIITIICSYILYFSMFFKGLSIGIYISSIFKIFGLSKGIIVFSLDVLIPQIFCLSAYVMIASVILNIYTSLKNDNDIYSKEKGSYIIICIISISFLALSIVFEQLVSSLCLGIYSNIS